ncbi:alpha/beta fold hydrolase [Hamadaea tsunoensis]|uniref:alpha/beta fold hydrolase n=1 Tax=Hamadaea tsunoensis TaxID=53368 RepID=UPI0004034F3A|nr:alpha/beta hydrolase [Hamadaea tsunoensis]
MLQQQSKDGEVVTPDGRTLRYCVTGALSGSPVFLLHGQPGSRNGPKPRGSVLYRLGVQLIAYDRPGYGGSTRHKGRSVADAAGDVLAIAQALGIERFAVVGRSGGAPHALACAALLPAVTRTAALVSVAPSDADDLDWFGGMTSGNVADYNVADADGVRLAEQLRIRADRIRRDPDNMLEDMLASLSAADLRVVGDMALRKLLTETYAEALREGPYGWIDDVFALRSPWGFRLGDVKGEVLLWHGADDTFSPVSHTRWLAEHIPGAKVQVQPAMAHFGAVEVLPDLLGWLTAGTHQFQI